MIITIHTDGACSSNPGKGAWAFFMTLDDQTAVMEGDSQDPATNNQMELESPIRALHYIAQQSIAFREPLEIKIYSDSQYVVKGITEWIDAWKSNGWKTSQKAPVKNKELWERLYELNAQLKPEWHWVRGHSTDPINNLVDNIAQALTKNRGTLPKSLIEKTLSLYLTTNAAPRTIKFRVGDNPFEEITIGNSMKLSAELGIESII